VGPSVHRALAQSPVEMPDGTRVERPRGAPQGGVVSPLLANLFMDYAFDTWRSREFPRIRFERYADDVLVHCVSQAQAKRPRGLARSRHVSFCKQAAIGQPHHFSKRWMRSVVGG
jgi:RNA-directed DNA polymerase